MTGREIRDIPDIVDKDSPKKALYAPLEKIEERRTAQQNAVYERNSNLEIKCQDLLIRANITYAEMAIATRIINVIKYVVSGANTVCGTKKRGDPITIHTVAYV